MGVGHAQLLDLVDVGRAPHEMGGRALHRVLGDALDARHRNKIVVEIRHRVADDDLELTGLGEGTLDHLHAFDLGDVGLGGVVEHEPHPGHAVRDCRNVRLAAYVFQQLGGVLLVFAHKYFLLQSDNLFRQVPFASMSILYLFKQVKKTGRKSTQKSGFSAQSTKKGLACWADSRYTETNV